jgi:hypothetical protein
MKFIPAISRRFSFRFNFEIFRISNEKNIKVESLQKEMFLNLEYILIVVRSLKFLFFCLIVRNKKLFPIVQRYAHLSPVQ